MDDWLRKIAKELTDAMLMHQSGAMKSRVAIYKLGNRFISTEYKVFYYMGDINLN